MSKKNKTQKLTLNKETVRVLTSNELESVAGGTPPVTTAITCGCGPRRTRRCPTTSPICTLR